jgi:hypothetical protein
MKLEVIGAGFGRTGTLSLKGALDQLGFGPTYHMVEVYANEGHADIWSVAINGGELDQDTLFEKYRSACDWPVCAFWREAWASNPQAKIILTTRDPDAWYASISKTIFQALEHEADDDALNRWRVQTRRMIFEQTFGNDLGYDNAIKVLRAHEADVIASVPAGELLVYDVKDGWEPLCEFLGVAVPDEPFPQTNSTTEFRVMTGLDT